MRENRCGNCKFWAAVRDHRTPMISENHDCRRHAPSPYTVADGHHMTLYNWPMTNHDDWCGDFVDFRVLGVEPDPLTK
jgi:hypothetical protein